MTSFRLQRNVWIFIFINLYTDVLECRDDLFKDMTNLTQFCPFTSFCGQNSSYAMYQSDKYEPCCRTCSCDSDCWLHGDCCFSHVDKFHINNDNTVICRSAFAKVPPIQAYVLKNVPYGHHYRMINKCNYNTSNIEKNSTECEAIPSNALGAFHPVVSPVTGVIYVNKYCALCNNEKEPIPWRSVVTCSPGSEQTLSDSIEDLIRGSSVNSSNCYVYYVPPRGFDLAPSATCNPDVIRSCKKENQKMLEYEELCKMYNATFVVQLGRFISLYANVYCFLCNRKASKNFSIGSNLSLCLKSGELSTEKFFSDNGLTVLLDLSIRDESSVFHGIDKNCPLNSVKFNNACREIRCPWGQFLLNNRCGYYSKTWVGGPFVVMLRMTPVEKTVSIPVSYFEDMPEHYKSDKLASWIKRKTLKRWNFFVMYQRYEDTANVEHLVVRATYLSRSLNPKHLKMIVEKTLGDKWQISYMNSSISFTVNFNDNIKYDNIQDIVDGVLLMNTSLGPRLRYPSWRSCLDEDLFLKSFRINEVLFPVSQFNEDWSKAVYITKLLLCDQIDLLVGEYELRCFSVLYGVEQKRIHTFSIVGPQEVKMADNMANKSTYNVGIRVCLYEFEPTADVATAIPFCFLILLPFVHFVL